MKTLPELPQDIGPAAVPQDAVSKAIWVWAHGRLPRYVLAHSIRVYAWAMTLGRDEELSVDAPVLWAASLMHDVGLARIPRNTRCFEFQGAEVARRFLIGAGMRKPDAERVGRAIELHMAPVVTLADGVESVLLDRATGIDVRGGEIELIAALRHAVMRAYPRGDFDRLFLAALDREIAIRPGCQSERIRKRLVAVGERNPWLVEVSKAVPSSRPPRPQTLGS
jgi:hypothetical protein